MTRLTREAQDIIGSGRREDGLAASDRARIRGKLARRLGAGLAAGALIQAGSATAEAARSTWFASLFTWSSAAGKVAVVSVVAAAAGAGFVSAPKLGLDHHSSTSSSSRLLVARPNATRQAIPSALGRSPSADEIQPAKMDQRAQLSTNEGATAATRREQESPASRLNLATSVQAQQLRTAPIGAEAEPSPVPATPSAVGIDLNQQVAALRHARAAIRQGDGTAALEAIDQGLPPGHFSPLDEESTLSRIMALCQLGRVAEARQYSESFLSRFPQSPLSGQVRNTCGFGVVRFSD